MIRISYNHRSSEEVDNIAIARDHIRTAMIQTVGGKHAADEMVEVATDDGIYCYRDQADADRDADGSRAFALIEREGGRNAR